MFLTGLALLPAIALVVWIYRQDKVEKEPRGLLWKIFLFGVLSVIPAMILEIILDEVFLVFVDADTLCYVILSAISLRSPYNINPRCTRSLC